MSGAKFSSNILDLKFKMVADCALSTTMHLNYFALKISSNPATLIVTKTELFYLVTLLFITTFYDMLYFSNCTSVKLYDFETHINL